MTSIHTKRQAKTTEMTSRHSSTSCRSTAPCFRQGSHRTSSFRRRPESSNLPSKDTGIQIQPLRIIPLDKFQFPIPVPFLDGLFVTNGRFHGFVVLKPDEGMHVVFSGKAWHHIVLVFPYAFYKIGCDTHIQGSVSAAGRKIDAQLHNSRYILDSGLRRNDEAVCNCALETDQIPHEMTKSQITPVMNP